MRCGPVVVSILILLFTAVTSGQVESARSFQQWNERLEALDPSRPIEYFELGEEVADAAMNANERSLARELFGIAGLLDRQGLGRSAALAIADLEDRQAARQRLRAAAELLADSGQVDPDASAGTGMSAEGRLAFCRALACLRRGDSARTSRHLAKADAAIVLEELGYMLPGGVARLKRDFEVYTGGLRPDISKNELSGHLVAESIALKPGKSTWSVVLRASEGAPLLVIDLQRLDRLFGADPSRPYWVGGRWVDRRTAAINRGSSSDS